ncbi:radical SAM protein [Verrucomicrobium sp. 3C]|uniref:radical SAM protein n=1 Tax=Verrucomicrobium sp. 3C TaxID=1134055 RepID=UPI00037F888F|nr:radical SAM protein [Verrucomicrobium sp. 3C]
MSFAWKSVGLMYTRRCPLACGHCVTRSSPRAEGKMDPKDAARYIQEAARVSPNLCFTGGEPLLYAEEIQELVALAADMGLQVSLVTGCGWAKQAERIEPVLEGLVDAGLGHLVISWDSFHEAFVRRETAVRVARSAANLGLRPRIRSVFRSGDSAEARAGCFSEFAPFALAHEAVEVLPVGRAASLPEESFGWSSGPPAGFCPSVVLPVVGWDGRVYACCGPSLDSETGSPLILGNALEEPLDRILARGRSDLVLHAIHAIGPRAMAKLIEEEVEFPSQRFAGICQACLALTNDPARVARIREKLADPEIRRLLAVHLLARRAGKPAGGRAEERKNGAALVGCGKGCGCTAEKEEEI